MAGELGSRTKNSLWSTVAATVTKTSTIGSFHCAICLHEDYLNCPLSNRSIITHYRTRHVEVYETLVRLHASKAIENQIKNFREAAYWSFAKSRKTKATPPFFRTSKSHHKNSIPSQDQSARSTQDIFEF